MERVFELVIVFVMIFCILGIVLFFNKPSSLLNINEGFKGGLDYSSYPQNNNMDSYTGCLVGGNSNLDCKRVWGYNGLYCTPDKANAAMYDPFYNTSSNMTCEGSGLHKSSGNVCMNDQQLKLLTTRGGNATSS